MFSVLNVGLGVFLVCQRPRDKTARLLGVALVGTGVVFNFASHSALVTTWFFLNPLHGTIHAVSGAAYAHALLVFPNGIRSPRWSLWLLVAGYLAMSAGIGNILLSSLGGTLEALDFHGSTLSEVYGALTAMLVGPYLGTAIGLQAAFRVVTGQGSAVAVVMSTLAIASLFQPLRRHIQDFIDRRFFQRKYDAARTLADCGDRIRDEVDLERLGDELVGVVQETMQPARSPYGCGKPARGGPKGPAQTEAEPGGECAVVNQQKWDSCGAEKVCCYEEEKASSLTALL